MSLLRRIEAGTSGISQDRLPDEYVDAVASLTYAETGQPIRRERFSFYTEIMKEGEVGNYMFVISGGLVPRFTVSRTGSERISFGGKGAFVGEIAALVEGSTRTATVSVSGGTEVLVLSTRDLMGMMLLGGYFDGVYKYVLNTALTRMRNMTDEDLEGSGILPQSQWTQYENGLVFPPIKTITPNIFLPPKAI